MSEDAAPPAGFEPATGRPSFAAHNGPYWVEAGRTRGARNVMRADERHANGYGIVHGGMVTAFLDGVMAQAVTRDTGMFGVTVQLSLHYLHAARPGDWIFADAEVVRRTRDLAFVEGRVSVDDRQITRATAVFKLMARRG